jgi:hypothetical protein
MKMAQQHPNDAVAKGEHIKNAIKEATASNCRD